jgi:hydrogenase maturation protease
MTGSGPLLIVGIGSDLGDDSAGRHAAERLVTAIPNHHVRSLRHPAALFDLLEGVERLHVIDACLGLGTCGTVRRFDWPAAELAAARFGGTHDLDLLSVLRLAEQLRLLPRQTTIWCIEAGEAAVRQGLAAPSNEVMAAVEQVVQSIACEVDLAGDPLKEAAGHA